MIAPIQTRSKLESILKGDEWILFQIKEGPCAIACNYCYETPVAQSLLSEAMSTGKIPKTDLSSVGTAELARFISTHDDKLGLEMSVEEISRYFSLLKEAGISRAGLIGSEPTMHNHFDNILETAQLNKTDLLVYTGGMNLHKVEHPAIKWIVLHLDYGRLGTPEELVTRFQAGELPSDTYMANVNALADSGKEIHLRINFSDETLWERNLIYSFYEKMEQKHRPNTLLKYSFSTKVSGEPNLHYFTPATLRAAVAKITSFVDEFKTRFPEVPMYAERPLFPCSFEPEVWKMYTQKGGFVSRCYMEYTFYPNSGLALCPPSRQLESGQQINTAVQLVDRIEELRKIADDKFRIPSFPECVPCDYRLDLTCQGGCGGYKVEEKALTQIRRPPHEHTTR